MAGSQENCKESWPEIEVKIAHFKNWHSNTKPQFEPQFYQNWGGVGVRVEGWVEDVWNTLIITVSNCWINVGKKWFWSLVLAIQGPCAIHLHNVKPPSDIHSNPATHMISEPSWLVNFDWLWLNQWPNGPHVRKWILKKILNDNFRTVTKCDEMIPSGHRSSH